MFPIKYIDNNLVWNKDNEVFAYYELIPYNYSFLSPEQKYLVHDSFRQLIAQSREGKIHALQIATESSIRSIQEQSKKLVTGKLREVAIQKIDDQTEALVSMIGDNQVDYRFFLGFKLMVTEDEVNLKNIKKSVFLTFRVPWDWTYTAGTVADWVAQFSFGFYSLMLTSLLLGLIVMVLYKPRTWCAFCPMGTMTQSICKLKNKE